MANNLEQKEVFISYSTKNTELAEFLCQRLEGSGVSCWIAPRDIASGMKWASAIDQGIESAKVVVLLVSEASLSSEEVEKEIDLANSQKKPIFPVRLENAALKGAFRYHLNNKQWVDAIEDDKFTRFDATVEAILKIFDRDAFDHNDTDGSVFALSRTVANELNQKHKQQLSNVNTMFSVRADGQNRVSLFFPIRFGASGVDLIFCFDAENKKMAIYADAAYDGDPIKSSFTALIQSSFSYLFPNLNITKGARRWRFVELIPLTELTSKLADVSREACFIVFKENVIAFTEKVLPKIFEWAEYSREVSNAINTLEDRLKAIFPEEQGWRIGAPEGERLNGYRAYGKINVYKKTWLPTDDYRGRGLLSITLESSGAFLDSLYIGILKYEPWLELGEFKDRLITEGNKELGQTGTPEDWWPWWQYLDEPWRSSGIGQTVPKWKDRLNEFVEYCLGRFENVKKLEQLLDDACAAIPALQIKDPNTFPPEMQQKWASSSFYIQNCMRLIAEEIQKELGSKCPEASLETGYRFRGGSNWNDVYLKVKVANFDAVIAFKFYEREMKTEFFNLEPPDFETPVLKSYFAKRNCDKVLQETLKVSSDCDDNTVSAWMERFQQFVKEKLDLIIPALVAFKKHLENVVALTKLAEKEISSMLTTADGWLVTNEAASLEKSKAIMFWRKSWLRIGSQTAELPPLVFQIYADASCFEDLYLSVRYEGKPLPELERKISAVCGACDFAFGIGDSQAIQGVWSRKLDTFHKTGGSSFERPLIDGDERSSFAGYLRGIAEQIKKMEPIIAEISRIHNESI